MILLYTVSFLLFSMCIFTALDTSPSQLTDAFWGLITHKKNIKSCIQKATNPPKKGKLHRLISDCKAVLKNNNRTNTFSYLCTVSAVLSIIGALIASAMNNILLMPILAGGFALLPFIYILLSAGKYRLQLNEELYSSLSTINSAYERSENFILAVSENLQYLRNPIKPVFEHFLYSVNNINPNIETALEQMKTEVSHSVFHEWVNAVILCQHNRDNISTLFSISAKISDIKSVNGNVQQEIAPSVQQYFLFIFFAWCPVLFCFLFFNSIYNSFISSSIGQGILLLLTVCTFSTLVYMVYIVRPIEYRR